MACRSEAEANWYLGATTARKTQPRGYRVASRAFPWWFFAGVSKACALVLGLKVAAQVLGPIF